MVSEVVGRAGKVILCRLAAAGFVRVPISAIWRDMRVEQGFSGRCVSPLQQALQSVERVEQKELQKIASTAGDVV